MTSGTLSAAMQDVLRELDTFLELREAVDDLAQQVRDLEDRLELVTAPERWPAVMPAAQAHQYLGISLSLFNQLVRMGEIHPNQHLSRLAGHRMFDLAELERVRCQH